MRLELCTFPVSDVVFGERTSYDGGSLQINRDELVKMVLAEDGMVR